jgi:hypothetical protein
MPFDTIEEALLFNRREQLQDMEVVILHASNNKMVLPVGKTWATSVWGPAPVPFVPRRGA